MAVLRFLVDTVFFLLVAACLLRAWLNVQRIHMGQQPGPFLMALSDWIVKPLRRGLPSRWQRSRWDVASLLAAVCLAFFHAAAWLGLASLAGSGASVFGGALALMALPALALKALLHTLLQGMQMLLLGYVLLSWIQPFSPMLGWLNRLVAPWLAPLRRALPQVGGVDLSPLVLMVLLQVALMLLGG
jgi:YggT family protein